MTRSWHGTNREQEQVCRSMFALSDELCRRTSSTWKVHGRAFLRLRYRHPESKHFNFGAKTSIHNICVFFETYIFGNPSRWRGQHKS